MHHRKDRSGNGCVTVRARTMQSTARAPVPGPSARPFTHGNFPSCGDIRHTAQLDVVVCREALNYRTGMANKETKTSARKRKFRK